MTQTKSFEERITSLFFLIGRNMRQQNAEHCDFHNQERLSIGQIEALKFIRERKNPLMKEVANHLSIAAPSLTPIIDELEKRKLIERGASESDRRAVLIFLTDAGREMLDKILKIKDKNMHYLFGKLTESEQEALIKILEKIASSDK